MIVAPSLLAANFLDLKTDIKRVEASNAKWLHLDVMDGNFVPNITFGYDLIKSIRGVTDLFLDTHLMIADPEFYLDKFIEAQPDLITIHFEAVEDYVVLEKLIKRISNAGIKSSVAINPDTPVEKLNPILEIVDMVLLMSVNPGFGGQKFNPNVLDKIKYVRSEFPNLIIQVDGGINEETSKLVKEAGANCLVAGSYLFNDELNERVDILLS